MLRSTVGHTRAELYRQWQEWRAECCRRRDAGGLVAVPQLQLLCRVSELGDGLIPGCRMEWNRDLSMRLVCRYLVKVLCFFF